jgi:hypothetical protein
MANTTFSGPVRSQGGFQIISIADGTGTETVTNTFGANTTITGNLTVDSTIAPVAGGAQAIQMGTTAGFGIYFGSGAPTITAAQGSLYLRTDGSSTSTRAYINSDGGTTWVAVTTAS